MEELKSQVKTLCMDGMNCLVFLNFEFFLLEIIFFYVFRIILKNIFFILIYF